MNQITNIIITSKIIKIVDVDLVNAVHTVKQTDRQIEFL